MRTPTTKLLETARDRGFAVGAFNINTEVRSAYTGALRELIEKSFANSSAVELIDLMQESICRMKEAVQAKLCLFGSADQATLF